MTYPPEEDKRMEALLRALQDMIQKQDYFDILHSKRSGYIYLTAEPDGRYVAELIESLEQMVGIVILELGDAIRKENGKRNYRFGDALSEWERKEVARRLSELLEHVEGDRACYEAEARRLLGFAGQK